MRCDKGLKSIMSDLLLPTDILTLAAK